MDLKHGFLAALRGGQNHDALLELVHRHQAQGLTPQEAYQIMQQLWLDFGFDKAEEGSGLQDDLEYVMEKIWYECPAPGR
ncbi:MAG TPA: hypothetical protein VG013_00355 [Gemmataceae bacterium]|jgi:hypothetical protein|nr:hypothetical protein [Gemmataceae bacterium]